jgi:hypothetical protein
MVHQLILVLWMNDFLVDESAEEGRLIGPHGVLT